jgi:plastocyanin
MTGTVIATGPAVAPPSPEPGASAAPESPAPGPVEGTAVSIIDLTFAPEDLAVPLGATVDWTNDDPFEHTVTATDGTFDSGVIAATEAFTWTFDSPGTFEYFCAIHPSMVGTVTVGEPNGAAAATGAPP